MRSLCEPMRGMAEAEYLPVSSGEELLCRLAQTLGAEFRTTDTGLMGLGL